MYPTKVNKQKKDARKIIQFQQNYTVKILTSAVPGFINWTLGKHNAQRLRVTSYFLISSFVYCICSLPCQGENRRERKQKVFLFRKQIKLLYSRL